MSEQKSVKDLPACPVETTLTLIGDKWKVLDVYRRQDLSARTRVSRLYAAGECSHTGVHGRNRLASNSLLEALVFGRRAAQDISAHLKREQPPLGPAPEQVNLGGKPMHHGYRTKIREILQNAYFVIPKPEAFQEGLSTVNQILQELETGGYARGQDFVEAKRDVYKRQALCSRVSGSMISGRK